MTPNDQFLKDDPGFGSASECLESPHRTRLLSLALSTLLLFIFAIVEWHDIGGSFSNDFDEGVYLCSARMVNEGYPLFRSLFSSQPPLFLEALATSFRIFGESVEVGRGMVLCFALLSLAATAWIAWQLFGPSAAPLAMLWQALQPDFFQNARTCTAEMPSLSFALLAVGCLLMSRSKWQFVWPALGGMWFALGALSKLLILPILLPVLFLLCLLRHSTQTQTCTSLSIRPRSTLIFRFLAFGIGCALTGVIVLIHYDIIECYDQTVRFHQNSRLVFPLGWNGNSAMLNQMLLTNFGVVISAIVGIILLYTSNRRACVLLCLWLAATGLFILTQSPLFSRHLIIMSPPLALAASSSFFLIFPSRPSQKGSFLKIYFLILPLISLHSGLQGIDFSVLRCMDALKASFPEEERTMIRLIERCTKPRDKIVSDQQMQVFRAGRTVDPFLCDTSFNRIRSGYLSGPEAIRAARSAKMVILWTHRLDEIQGFDRWVESNYDLLENFGNKRAYILRHFP